MTILDLIPKIIFAGINVAVSALIFYLWEINADVFNFIVCCLLIGFDGAVLDCAFVHGKSQRKKGGW